MKLKSFTIISRYLNRKNSSLAFWWIPVTAGKTTQKGREMDYYVDFAAKADYDLLFDEKGVMMLDYLGTVGKQYNPCAVAQYGLGLLSRYYQTKENKWKEKAMIQADWLIDQMRFTPKGIARLEYVFEYGSYQMIQEKNYISGIAQAQALSFLTRIDQITHEDRYRKGINGLFQSFLYPIQEGGVINYDSQGRLYIEEILTERVSCVLDGFMYGIFGVYDYYLFTGDKQAKRIFEQACCTLSDILPEYDLKFWSRADCYLDHPKMPASAFYHNVHICQLDALYTITQNKTFKKYADQWRKYQNNWFYRKAAFFYKCWFKLFFY